MFEFYLFVVSFAIVVAVGLFRMCNVKTVWPAFLPPVVGVLVTWVAVVTAAIYTSLWLFKVMR